MFAVLLSGGVGSRLWPVSTRLHPKPFIKLDNGLSIYQNTVQRLQDLSIKGLVNVTGRDLCDKVRKECDQVIDDQKLKADDVGYLLEPFGRGTAAAIACATLWLREHNMLDEIMLVTPSDHVIGNFDAFSKAVEHAKLLAQDGKIVTFGIKPTTPETGFGYIKYNGNAVERFVEKPNLETAIEYVNRGQYLWNSGMFCFKASVMLDEMSKHCPDILAASNRAYDGGHRKHGNVVEMVGYQFAGVRDDTIDYAIMEKSDQIAVVPCDINWSDVGSWTAVASLFEKDDQGNVKKGDVILRGVSDCYIHSENKPVAVIGVKDLIIVESENGILVVHKDKVQDVKHVFNELDQRPKDEANKS